MSLLCIAESLTRLACVINTTFSEKIYSRWCCIDRLRRQVLSECGPKPLEAPGQVKPGRCHATREGCGRQTTGAPWARLYGVACHYTVMASCAHAPHFITGMLPVTNGRSKRWSFP